MRLRQLVVPRSCPRSFAQKLPVPAPTWSWNSCFRSESIGALEFASRVPVCGCGNWWCRDLVRGVSPRNCPCQHRHGRGIRASDLKASVPLSSRRELVYAAAATGGAAILSAEFRQETARASTDMVVEFVLQI